MSQVPPYAGDARRFFASVIDAILSLACGLIGGAQTAMETIDGVPALRLSGTRWWLTAIGVVLAVSFFNHVVLTWAARCSMGKFLTGLRVLRAADGGRARFWQLIRRWLIGLFWLVIIVPLAISSDNEVLEQKDLAGLRIVRN